ncbi:hypothetical protein LCGC14_2611560 [marine sediment metagenome]|uniref:4Fe4S-binding SPASM domain-containing protein n=1 Tax=marine sediment metagenome TaxID=412755 RepID=A0A0F9CGS6_9ZZZZ
MLTGLYAIHLELTSRCNKSCWMCGRRRIDKDYPDIAIKYGDMDIDLVRRIAKQIPAGMLIHFHNNGEPLVYPYFAIALRAFKHCIRHFDTNGKLLVEKADEIIDNCNVVTVSVIPKDLESDKQYEIVKEFLKIKGNSKPRLVVRFNGDIEKSKRWKDLGIMIINRMLHHPMGSYNYEKIVVKPEIGMCLEVLNHLAIDRFGRVSPCVRFDPFNKFKIGSLHNQSINDIWNGEKRKDIVKKHINGERNTLPLCKECDYWGIPRGL